jgi:hypothetical protein
MGVRDLTPLLLRYFTAVQASKSLGSGFRIMFLTCVELRGFEPRTSCMPSSGNPSTVVHQRRSPSLQVPSSPPGSRHVAVLRCCTARCPYRSAESYLGQRREIPCFHAPILLIGLIWR